MDYATDVFKVVFGNMDDRRRRVAEGCPRLSSECLEGPRSATTCTFAVYFIVFRCRPARPPHSIGTWLFQSSGTLTPFAVKSHRVRG